MQFLILRIVLAEVGECLMQAWYREGCAAHGLQRYEDAAQAFFEAYRLDPTNQDLAQRFKQSVHLGQQQHQAANASNT